MSSFCFVLSMMSMSSGMILSGDGRPNWLYNSLSDLSPKPHTKEFLAMELSLPFRVDDVAPWLKSWLMSSISEPSSEAGIPSGSFCISEY